MLKNFALSEDAQRYAEQQARLINAGQLAAAQMTDQDRQAYVTACRIVEPTGMPLVEAAKTFAGAVAELDGRAGLIEAVRDYVKRHATMSPEKRVPDVIEELIVSKRQDGASHRYLKTLRSQLAPSTTGRTRPSFADSFPTYISSIKAQEIDDWLRSRSIGLRTRRNFIMSIRVLFNFAKSRGYLPKSEPTEADFVPVPKVRGGNIGILKPEELRALLAGSPSHRAKEEFRLWLVLGAFTGLRTEELKRLEWDDIHIDRGFVEVTARKAKTASRRLVPIQPNLAAWLLPFSRRTGKVFPRERADERVHAYARRLGLQWPPNALRHSYATYRLATTPDIARVALEMGNSPAMLVKHYRELATPKQGEEWFSIVPHDHGRTLELMAVAA